MPALQHKATEVFLQALIVDPFSFARFQFDKPKTGQVFTPVLVFISLYFFSLADAASTGGIFLPVLNMSGVLLPAGDTLKYPCISWCNALQKSVQ